MNCLVAGKLRDLANADKNLIEKFIHFVDFYGVELYKVCIAKYICEDSRL